MPSISVVVPCFNEAEVIVRFHRVLLAELNLLHTEFEIYYVDDGSRDVTLSYLQEFARQDLRVRYISFSRNFGKESAILAGLRGCRGEAVILMDADLQHPPKVIRQMLELYRQHGCDQVVATRRDHAEKFGVQALLRKAYFLITRHCMNVELVDGHSDFRLLSRRAVDAVITLPEGNRFSKGIFSWIGFHTRTLPYVQPTRLAGHTKWGSRRLLNYAIDGMLSFNSQPLRLVIHLGMLLLLGALAYAGWTGFHALVYGVRTPGFATLIAAITGLAGIQLATLGVIGEYVGRIYSESKRRPHYVVSEASDPAATVHVPAPSTPQVEAGSPR